MRLSITNERVEQLRRLRGEPKFVDLKDIFVLPSYRGRGYGKKLVEAMLAKLDHEEVPALMLATQDAHSLYRKLGFEVVEGSVKLMRRVRK